MSNPVTFSDPSGYTGGTATGGGSATAEYGSIIAALLVVAALTIIITPNPYFAGQSPIYYLISEILSGVAPPDIKIPDFPDIDFPDIDFPDIDLPDIDLPEIDLPDFDFPSLPDIPDLGGFPVPPELTLEDWQDIIDRIIGGSSGNENDDGGSGRNWGKGFWKLVKAGLAILTGSTILGGDSSTPPRNGECDPQTDDECRQQPSLIWRAISLESNRIQFNWNPTRIDWDGLSGTRGGGTFWTEPEIWFAAAFQRPPNITSDRIVGTTEASLIGSGFTVENTPDDNDPFHVSIGGNRINTTGDRPSWQGTRSQRREIASQLESLFVEEGVQVWP
jgi:hypothetical protein